MRNGLEPGAILGGRYRIVRLLAEGGMGAVYEAQHTALGRRVALKTLLAEFQDDQRLVQRFIREARATCTVAHRNVVTVLDIDQTPEGMVYFVMEYLEGDDLENVLAREGPLPWRRVQKLALQICSALAEAHARGIVHRDLKPSNCVVVREGAGEIVKLLDFGIAKVLERSGSAAGGRTGRELRWLKTSTGEVFGTLTYMAPEHLNGDRHDHQVDVYALGVILYELLTGAPPFTPDAPGTFVQQVLFETPEAPSQRAPRAGIPPDLDYVVLRALEKRPEDRFSSMREFAEALATVRVEAAPAIAVTPAHDWLSPAVMPASGPSAAAPRAETPARAKRAERPAAAARAETPARAKRAERPASGRGGRLLIPGLGLGLALALALAFGPRLLGRVRGGGPEPASTPPAMGAPAPLTPALKPPAPEPAPTAAVASGSAPGLVQSALGAPPEPPGPEPAEVEAAAPAPAPPRNDASGGSAEAPPQAPRKSAPTRPRPRELEPMTITPVERRQIFAPHRDAIARLCKQRLASAVLPLQVTIEGARVVSARLLDEGDRERQAAARCIAQYVRSRVTVPARFSGRTSFPYAF